ncbi:hypothetical protein ACFP6B_01285 [Rothia nasimurium]|uniref:hypothetical protein n=1 Tax=Rothia nasimurium TaxID=85336 RepID=UPI00361197E3
MGHLLFIEPASSGAEADQLAGVNLADLRQSILSLPGVEKIYPRSPYLLRSLKTAQKHLEATRARAAGEGQEASPGGNRPHSTRSAHGEDQPTDSTDRVRVRIGAAEGVQVPQLACQVGTLLAQQLPEHTVEVEIVSC